LAGTEQSGHIEYLRNHPELSMDTGQRLVVVDSVLPRESKFALDIAVKDPAVALKI